MHKHAAYNVKTFPRKPPAPLRTITFHMPQVHDGLVVVFSGESDDFAKIMPRNGEIYSTLLPTRVTRKVSMSG